ncbi:hypothetical protein [Parvicella tangerina]|uniref:Cytochrome C Planctomycete-type domain-containing protein n=1 Tax=Parvicella tangerina TaxID=2829795 RepID=A0A916NHM3_9FLAO|nr:hypothetical protein [Parvicella tangerina]CAG5081802.1 hypothetical protein CRYO30217_01732 [Parvicella tangerina]
MKRKVVCYSLGVFGSLVLMSGSCDKKEVVCDGNHAELTYEKDIKPIIDDNCIHCHEGYSSFTGLKVSINNGAFEREVIVRQTMPQGGKLKMEELVMIKCWLDGGADEK